MYSNVLPVAVKFRTCCKILHLNDGRNGRNISPLDNYDKNDWVEPLSITGEELRMRSMVKLFNCSSEESESTIFKFQTSILFKDVVICQIDRLNEYI